MLTLLTADWYILDRSQVFSLGLTKTLQPQTLQEEGEASCFSPLAILLLSHYLSFSYAETQLSTLPADVRWSGCSIHFGIPYD